MPGRAAVVIGINYTNFPANTTAEIQSKAELNPLRFAENDALEMKKELEEAGYGVQILLGASATRQAIINSIRQQRLSVGSDGLLVIHFSGHGDLDDDNTAYLLPVDADPQSLSASAIPMDQIPRYLGNVGTALTLLDCCHSGYAVDVRGDRGRPFLRQASDVFNNVRGRVVLAACAGDQIAREKTTLRHGAFTYYILEHWRRSPTKVTDGSLFDSVDTGLQWEGLARPVKGGYQEGGITLREAPNNANQLQADLNTIDKRGWAALLKSLKIQVTDLRSKGRAAQVSSLIARAIRESWLSVLEGAIQEQVEIGRQIAEGLNRLAEIEAQKINPTSHRIQKYWDDMQKHWGTVIELGNRVLQLDADNQIARCTMARAYAERSIIYYQRKDLHRSIEAVECAIALDGQQADLYATQGAIYRELGNLEIAIRAYGHAIYLEPSQAVYYASRADLYLRKSAYDAAIDDYDHAIRIAPEQAEYLVLRGDCYRKKGITEKALQDYIQAFDKSFLWKDYIHNSCYEKLISFLNDLITDDREAIYYQRLRASIYYRNNDYALALADLIQIIESSPRPQDYSELGKVYYAMKQLDDAIKYFKIAIDVLPNHEIYFLLGECYSSKHNYEPAIANYDLAIAGDSQNTDYYFSRAAAYMDIGEKEKAKEDMRRSRSLNKLHNLSTS